MIRYVGCDYARPRLDAFADGELAMGDQVLVETHLRWCQTCAARLEDAQTIGDSLRLMAREQAHDCAHAQEDGAHAHGDGVLQAETGLGRALAAMQGEVVAQAHIEYEQSMRARVQELFSDMRLWWPALGATVAVALSVGVASNIWKATSNQQPASLAAIIENLADPGSNRNPQRLDAAMYMPRMLDDGIALDDAMLTQHDGENHLDEEVAFFAALTREGTIGDLRHMPASGVPMGTGEMERVLHAVRQSRFAPAQRPGGQVVASKVVLLWARTTVKASQQTVDLGIPLTRPVLAARPPAAKPAGLAPAGATPLQQSGAPIASASA